MFIVKMNMPRMLRPLVNEAIVFVLLQAAQMEFEVQTAKVAG
jgi:hypothetical protein